MRAPKILAIAAAATFALGLAACGGSDDSPDTSAAPSASAPPAPTTSAPMMGGSFGAGCSAVPTDPSNAGSFEAMAKVPVATAASGNPVLTTLVTAVKKAGLVDSLNSADGITVFAPANAAFEKIPQADLNKVLADKATLTKLLTFHVVSGKLTPEQLAGSHKTLEGDEVMVSGGGTDFTVNGDSKVVCGNVQTANATVYIVDTVLMPKA